MVQPEPEAVAGLLFCGDRVQWRGIGRLTAALGIALGGGAPPEMFEALADTPEEAHRQYQRYLAHQRVQHASGAVRETL